MTKEEFDWESGLNKELQTILNKTKFKPFPGLPKLDGESYPEPEEYIPNLLTPEQILDKVKKTNKTKSFDFPDLPKIPNHLGKGYKSLVDVINDNIYSEGYFTKQMMEILGFPGKPMTNEDLIKEGEINEYKTKQNEKKNEPIQHSIEIPGKTKLIDPERCKQYRELGLALPESIDAQTLDEISDHIRLSPLTRTINMLEENVTLKQIPSSQNIMKAHSLLQLNQRILRGDDLFDQGLPPNYQVKICKPDISLQEFADQMNAINNCWSSLTNSNNFIEWLHADIHAGATLYLMNQRPNWTKNIPVVQTRLFVAKKKNDKPILFMDTIEGGDMFWDRISEWAKNGRAKELMYTLATTISVAKAYGIEEIALAECEMQEFGRDFLFPEKNIFNNSDKKIGYAADHLSRRGPYAYKLQGSPKSRVMNIADVATPTHQELREKVDTVSEFLANTRINKIPYKTAEIGYYLDAISELNTLQFQDKDLENRTNNLRTEYLGVENKK